MVPRKRFTILAMSVAFGAWSIASLARSPAPAAAAPPKLADTIEQRVAACAICHGKLGEGTARKPTTRALQASRRAISICSCRISAKEGAAIRR